MEDEPITTEETIRRMLYFILIILGIFVAASLFPSTNTTHPPQVNIFRVGDTVDVIWMGGIDDVFVGNFSVTIDNKTDQTTYFPKPLLFQKVVSIKNNDTICVDVKAIDRAVQTYRPIGYACL